MSYPVTRMRRLRMNERLRRLVRETRLSPDKLVYPMFVCPGEGIKQEIPSMPGNYQCSIDVLVEEVRSVQSLGISGIILFGIPPHKDEAASSALDPAGIIQQALRALKRETTLLLITDVCLCEYTSHGHCGLVENNEIVNDASLEVLAQTALSHAEEGADIVAPSDMMDGRVAAIRAVLDKHGHEHLPILSYAVKYASAFYGPFREAAGSTPEFGDRRSHQMDPANVREALREAELDIDEGADILMVKPAGPYLDVIRRIRERYNIPVAAYQVSGEFAALVAAARLGWLDLERVSLESLIGIRRAGAEMILTYFAKDVARLIG